MNAPNSANVYDPGLEASGERADLLATSADNTEGTQIIAIYGKGGIGKSFTLANLSYMMAQQGKKVLLIGCDPKSDTTSLLFGGRSCPTIIETSSNRKASGEEVEIGDVCLKRDGVFAMELGGPEVGRGCGGRGIIHGFELLEKLGFQSMNQVDPFDGGPYYGAARDAIVSVRERRELVLPGVPMEHEQPETGVLALLTTEGALGFRGTVVPLDADEAPIVSAAAREALGVESGDRVGITPLP